MWRSWSSLYKVELYFCSGRRDSSLGHPEDDVTKIKGLQLTIF